MQVSEKPQEGASLIQTPDKSAKRLLRIGFGLSAAYLVPMLIYSFVELPHMKAMKPDEFATFLSGAFAPLAFLWLVLGFRQQGDELQNSARALWLQGEELRNSVEQQRQLVEVSKEQLEAEREQHRETRIEAIRNAQPQFVISENGSSYSHEETKLDYILTIGRSTCSDVLIEHKGQYLNKMAYLGLGGEMHFRVSSKPGDVAGHDFSIIYTDLFGDRKIQHFTVPLVSGVSTLLDRHRIPMALGEAEPHLEDNRT